METIRTGYWNQREQETLMSECYTLPTKPEGMVATLRERARHVFVAGDIAQIVLDWSIDGTGPDGKHVHLGGSASDILRRGADGLWRYIIDNSQGTAVRQPA
jgi:ketosteroid isomerase-like protein